MALDLTNPPPAPPEKKSTPRRSRNSSTVYEPPKRPIDEVRQESVEGLFQLAMVPLAMFGQTADAATCSKYAEPAATQVVKLADKHESIATIVDYLGKIGPYAELVAVLVPFGLQIMVNHERLPAAPFGKFGVVEPVQLEAELKTQMMRAEAEAARQAREAMTEARQAEAEYMREMALSNQSHAEQDPPAA